MWYTFSALAEPPQALSPAVQARHASAAATEKDDYISSSSELINENGNYDSTDSYYQKGIIFTTKDDSKDRKSVV